MLTQFLASLSDAQRSFAVSFQQGYVPSSDEDLTAKVAEEFAEGSTERYDRFVRETSPDLTAYHRMQAMVRRYVSEIEEVEALYPGLLSAKSEVDRYQVRRYRDSPLVCSLRSCSPFGNVAYLDHLL
jgi:hypothetical protein